MKRLQFIAALSVVCIPMQASAWECLFQNCPVQCNVPVTYAVGDLPTGVDETVALGEIQRAFDAWNAPDCFDFQFQYLGRASELTDPASIVVGVLPWSDQFGGSFTWATALTSVGNDGCIVGSITPNLALNDDDFTWTTDGSADFTGTVDLYTVVLGRMGSLLGLGNSDDPQSVVRSSQTSAITTGILSSDEDAVCYLYADGTSGPASGGKSELMGCTECSTDADCESGQICKGVAGAGVCLAPCETDGSCAGDGQCFVIGGNEMFCFGATSANGVLVCPDPDATPPGEPDMGTEMPDLGGSAPDVGNPGESDMGSSSTDPTPEATGGDDGGCSMAGTAPISPGLLLLAGFAALSRRRRSV